MDPSQPPFSTNESSDIFSLTDQVLSEKLQFIEEIGFGNWGSVWLCRPKSSSGAVSSHKIAVKLVHRSKTSTTAARVRSLWNEMKIVRTFKNDPHPSIIPFHSFIITPSYALITMDYLPTLVPVEVEEKKARTWFRSLLSGVEFLHRRGVVHNDIKPANILLSSKGIPVLVDFGFAEKYDLESPTAFQSNLSYGTPEYLSPERARGLPHDTRKSDVWSLGVTFFEILVGRTPFEHSDGEQFTTKEDLEKYWARTLKGKWVGTWNLSQGFEKLLHRMIAPNADLRCTAAQAMADPYWQNKIEPSASHHRRSSSYTSTIVFEKDMAKILNLASPWKSKEAKEGPRSPPGLDSKKAPVRVNSPQLPIARVKSQAKVAAVKAPARKRVPGGIVADLTPIKGSPPTTPSMLGKENASTRRAVASPAAAAARKPFGIVSPRQNQNTPVKPMLPTEDAKEKRRSRILGDLSNSRNAENANFNVRTNANGTKRPTGKDKDKAKDSVRARVIEWEREKERLREIARLEELERERDEEFAEEAEMLETMKANSPSEAKPVEPVEEGEQTDQSDEVENDMSSLQLPPVSAEPPVLPMPATVTPLTPDLNFITSSTPQRQKTSSSGLGALRYSIKKSLDTTFRLYKTSAIGQIANRVTSPRGPSFDLLDECSPERSAKRDALRTSIEPSSMKDEFNEDGRGDRLDAWMRNVEKVVEDARQGFESSSNLLLPPPPLPIAPVTRSASQKRTNRSSRLPRKVLAANEIFTNDSSNSTAMDQTNQTFDVTADTSSAFATAGNVTIIANHSTFFEGRSGSTPAAPEMQTPSRQRRATVSSRSPEPMKLVAFELEATSPSKRREKSKSHGNLFQQHITPIALLEAGFDQVEAPTPSPRLSAVIDPSVFIARPVTPIAVVAASTATTPNTSKDHSNDSLSCSPLHVEPYPQRPTAGLRPPVDTPTQRKIEGVYDRFLMATSGVKRLGKGYQSDNAGPVGHTVLKKSQHHSALPRPFQTSRRPMPPPVSSEDCQRLGFSVDELGVMTHSHSLSSREGAKTPSGKEDGTGATITLMRRAIKAIVPAKTASRRVSRAVAA